MNTINQTAVMGIDIGGTNIRIGLISEDRNLYCFEKSYIFEVYDPANPLDSLTSYIKDYIKKHDAWNVKAIGIGFPSIISKDMKIVYSSPNLPGFNNINVVDELTHSLQVPIFINNDVNLHLNYEIQNRGLQDKESVLGFYIGTGYGNAIYLNGSFLAGSHGIAGELGHIPALNNDIQCSCGNIGCVETIASGKYLVEMHREHFSDIPFEVIFQKLENHPLIEQFIECVAIPIATEVTIFDPDCIVLGGGVIQMEGFPLNRLKKIINNYTRKPYPEYKITILDAEYHKGTGVLGAGYYVWNELKNKPDKGVTQ